MEYTIENLLRSWIKHRLHTISEWSGDWDKDYADLHDEAHKYCDALGIEWSEDFLPDYVWEALAVDAE